MREPFKILKWQTKFVNKYVSHFTQNHEKYSGRWTGQDNMGDCANVMMFAANVEGINQSFLGFLVRNKIVYMANNHHSFVNFM